jgi:hypothetical protein
MRGSRCSLFDSIVSNSKKRLLETKQNEKVQDCIIRVTCIWFTQQGYEAYKVCSEVVTDLTYNLCYRNDLSQKSFIITGSSLII